MPRNVHADLLWDQAHSALLGGRWGEARALIDTLNYSHSAHAVDELLTMEDLKRAGVQPPPFGYDKVLQDRISLWNAHVQRNWAQG